MHKKAFEKVEGKNFTAARIGKWTELDSYSFNHPNLNKLQYGKLFLKHEIGLTGMEVSINKLAPGEQMAYSHKHKNNEELFVFLKGRGQFQIDNDVVDVSEGTVIRVAPDAIRTWVNNSDEDLYFIIIQGKAGSMNGEEVFDGIPVGHAGEFTIA